MSEESVILRRTSQELLDLAAQLLVTQGEPARARLLASAIAEPLNDAACLVYRADASEATGWRLVGKAGAVSLAAGVSVADAPTVKAFLDSVTEDKQAIAFNVENLQHGDLMHLQTSRPVVSIAYPPLLAEQPAAEGGEALIGFAEVLTFAEALTAEEMEELQPLLSLGVPALAGAEAVEQQRSDLMDSVHRMTQLYDLEKSLNSTLELDHVMALIPRKVLPMVDCEAVHLWLFSGN